mgnify:CR=1 FL=1
MTETEHHILGIDPGTTVMGYSVLHTNLNHSEVEVISVIQMKKLPDQYAKLKFIYEKTNALVEQYHPDTLSVESPFYGKNAQSMMKLARAQGVIIAACLHAGLEVFEYTPRKIKQSITGKGSASKEQVAAMLKNMQIYAEDARYFDATDALAVAVCHQLQNRFTDPGKKYTGWESFITQNGDRIK